jgi:hypothetical protein
MIGDRELNAVIRLFKSRRHVEDHVLARVRRFCLNLPFASGRDWIKFLNRGLIVLGREMGVPDRRGDGLMPREFLYGPQIYAFHYQTADERMPQAVPGEVGDLNLHNHQFKPSPRVVQIPPEFGLTDTAIMGPPCV